ncbi:MAG: dihydroorotase [Flavobacteriaceae bacterium]
MASASAQRFDAIYHGGTVVNQNGSARADIGVRQGRFAALGDLSAADAGERVDCAGLHLLPGFIDTQVHFREPGLDHKEDLETGSRAAVMGGVTAVFEMPNTNPQTVTAAALEDKLARARGRMHCDFAFFIGGTHENVDELAELERLPGCAGVKVFIGSSTGDLLVEDDPGIRAILSRISRRASFHCEDEARLRERRGERVDNDPASHPVWRDEQAALIATTRLVDIARSLGKRVHVLHVTSAEEMDFLAGAKDVASVEVTPNHLTLAGPDAYSRLGTRAQMNPPVRDEAHRAALWRAVACGVADILGSDHAPHTLEEKQQTYPASPSGMTGVQTLCPVMLDHVAAGRLTLERLVDMTSAGPARLFNIACKGRIAAGYDADLTIVDLKRRETITNGWIASRSQWTPFDGVAVTGWPVGTVIRGSRVMWENELLSPSGGAAVRFLETLQPQG